MAVDLPLIRKLVAWLLLAASLFFLLTGFGISNWDVVSAVTYGLLGKAESFRVHEVLWAPFLLLLALHVTLNVFLKNAGKKKI
jgi:hypothetical protein